MSIRHAVLFNQSAVVALAAPQPPAWLRAPDQFQEMMGQLCNDFTGSDVDLPILIPSPHLDPEPNSQSDALRQQFRSWLNGSGRALVSQLLAPPLIDQADGVQRWAFMPAAPAKTIFDATRKRDPAMRHAWLNCLLGQARSHQRNTLSSGHVTPHHEASKPASQARSAQVQVARHGWPRPASVSFLQHDRSRMGGLSAVSRFPVVTGGR